MNKLFVRLAIIMFTLVFVLIVVIPIGIFAYVKINLYLLEKDTTHYLLNDKGYEKKDIIRIKRLFSKAPVFSVTVIFKDEPDIAYSYKKENGYIYQIGHSISKNSTFKHSELEDNAAPPTPNPTPTPNQIKTQDVSNLNAALSIQSTASFTARNITKSSIIWNGIFPDF